MGKCIRKLFDNGVYVLEVFTLFRSLSFHFIIKYQYKFIDKSTAFLNHAHYFVQKNVRSHFQCSRIVIQKNLFDAESFPMHWWCDAQISI